jgi:type VI secretion system protein VasD
MDMSLNRFSLVVLALVALPLISCASHGSNDRVQTRTLLSASNDANPDINGRPSPVVLRVFQLRNDTEFERADFLGLSLHEKDALGASLISVEEFELRPGEHLETRIGMSRDTRYVGAVAEFRDINSGRWRVQRTRPSHSLFVSESVVVDIERGTLLLSVNH